MTFRLSLDSMVMRSHWHLPIRAAIEAQWTWLSSWRYGTMCVSWNIKGATYICSFLFTCPKMQCTLIFDGGKIPSSMACRCLKQLSFLQFKYIPKVDSDRQLWTFQCRVRLIKNWKKACWTVCHCTVLQGNTASRGGKQKPSRPSIHLWLIILGWSRGDACQITEVFPWNDINSLVKFRPCDFFRKRY